MAIFARFRSADRDQQNDASRIDAVRAEIKRALLSVDREHEGLRRRLAEVSTRVATLMGNEDGIYFEREPDDEKLLVAAEGELMNGMRRVRELEAHREIFVKMMMALES